MSHGIFNVPALRNEPVRNYAPGSAERADLKMAIKKARSVVTEIPQYIGGEEIYSQNRQKISPPHDHSHVLGYFHEGDKTHVQRAIEVALDAAKSWSVMKWEQRAAIFLKAADLIAGPFRAEINAATMLGQSKNAYQAEIDSACELIDFLRMNVNFMHEIYGQQPVSSDGVWNRMEYRPLEGFIFAVTPFNFTAIAGNLPAAPAMMGNVVIWKPAFTQVYAAHVIMNVFRQAGLPAGVINMILADGPIAGDVIFKHPDFAGIHFTGSTRVFQTIWKRIGENIGSYKTFPRIVGETGGKDFVLAHQSADPKALATGLVRGAFEYQGQKCSAASRAYIPSNLWEQVKEYMLEDLAEIRMGGVEDFTNFVNAVIDEKAFDKITAYIDAAGKSADAQIIAGGASDKSTGYFVQPTIIEAFKTDYITLCEEIFGPVLTVYVYDADKFEEIIPVIDKTSPYALTGAVFAQDRYAIQYATEKLVNAAGNFYINDKPTGAVVGQQPFGGARASGTNDKAGSVLNLLRWVSPRVIKETLVSPQNYRYPFLNDD
ncbi:1-pyrroline-5-carboxylate dehydrogenase 1 [Dyadobacter sp. CECT 9275]|uniref:L-glutamate gamma-semialdehyde dehydrogenase n=1 Tax=Dyadobacter helix TaxID=2822344 RepID=A0A916NDW2_9BACT|nr:L-glutamate gamma-semialdehyde dehydrogenase [Dyadobacter sp. CECT 9275]CAG5010455.1 1-pyrroline-5-carboxylate dehydrogenase 1 [Dyadobacter sp. CECT 9275]